MVAQQVPLLQQELHTLPERLSSLLVLIWLIELSILLRFIATD